MSEGSSLGQRGTTHRHDRVYSPLSSAFGTTTSSTTEYGNGPRPESCGRPGMGGIMPSSSGIGLRVQTEPGGCVPELRRTAGICATAAPLALTMAVVAPANRRAPAAKHSSVCARALLHSRKL